MAELLRISQAAEELGVQPQTLYCWIRRGLVPAVQMGRTKRISRQVLRDVIAGARPTTDRQT